MMSGIVWCFGILVTCCIVSEDVRALRLPRSVRVLGQESTTLGIRNVHFAQYHRHARSVNHRLPDSFTAEFTIKGLPASYNLTKSRQQVSDFQTFSIKSGRKVVHSSESKPKDNQPGGYYYDVTNGASFNVICSSRSAKCYDMELTGYVIHEEAVYIIECTHRATNSYRVSRVQSLSSLRSDYTGQEQRLSPVQTRRRRATGDYTVELLIVADYSVYNGWYEGSNFSRDAAINNLKQYFAFMVNGIQVRYAGINAQYTIGVEIVGLVILEKPADSPFTENVRDTNDRVEAKTMLSNFNTWINNKLSTGSLPRHDHAMAFTQYDLVNNVDSATTGFAYLGKICTTQSQSVVEDQFNFISHTVAAHELAHSLNAVHDGDENACAANEHYIMAASSAAVNVKERPQSALNPWKFSTCSINEMSNKLNDFGSAANNCLLRNDASASDLMYFMTPAMGQSYGINQQCRYAIGSGSYACLSNYNGNYRNICTGLSCFDPGNDNCALILPADGTTCGDQRWCQSGVCVYNTSAPARDESCLYGDSKQSLSSSNTKCNTYIPRNPSQCYQQYYLDTCCASCQQEHTGVQGCEYGDRSPCNITHGSVCYDSNTQVQCCESCINYETQNSECQYGDRARNCAPPFPNPLITSAKSCYGNTTNGQALDTICCSTCQQYHTNIPSCPYGDAIDNCLTGDCRFYSQELLQYCCMTCRSYVTTPPTNPDTTTDSGGASSLPAWVIPAAAGGGGGLLILILIGVVCCACRHGDSGKADESKMAAYAQGQRAPPPRGPQDYKFMKQGHVNKAYYNSQGYIDPSKVSGPQVPNARTGPQGANRPTNQIARSDNAMNRHTNQSVRSDHIYMEIQEPDYQRLQRGHEASQYSAHQYQGLQSGKRY